MVRDGRSAGSEAAVEQGGERAGKASGVDGVVARDGRRGLEIGRAHV